jgi:transcriptional regulator with XRE-family HTH domain
MIGTPSVRRRLLGTALRQYRERLGYALDDAARVLECDRSKISRVETGQRGIRAKELRELLNEYGVGEEEQRTLEVIAYSGGWWRRYTEVLPGALLDFISMEAVASEILNYQPQLVPDLLQVPQYARVVADVDPALPAGVQDLLAELLRTRQSMILGERRSELTVVVGESALRQVVGGTEIMQAQLVHMAEVVSNYPQVTFNVLPFSNGAGVGGSTGPFTILRFGGAPGLGVVYLKAPSGGILLDSPQDVACYLQAFTQLRASALAPVASARFLRDTMTGVPA